MFHKKIPAPMKKEATVMYHAYHQGKNIVYT